MDYIDLRLGDFLNNFVQMTEVYVYETSYDETLLFHTRIGGLSHTFSMEDSVLEEGVDLNNYGIVYVSSTDGGIEIGVVEI